MIGLIVRYLQNIVKFIFWCKGKRADWDYRVVAVSLQQPFT